MNRLIILASITMMLYGKTQCCKSTYDASNRIGIEQKQYNDTINCSTNNYDTTRINQFRDIAESVTNSLSNITNETEFKFDRNVSFNDRSVYSNLINFNLTLFTGITTCTKLHKHHCKIYSHMSKIH